jgi:hypothetical protein
LLLSPERVQIGAKINPKNPDSGYMLRKIHPDKSNRAVKKLSAPQFVKKILILAAK